MNRLMNRLKLIWQYFIRYRGNKVAYLRSQGAKIGQNCFLYNSVNAYSEPYLIEIGNNVTIAAGVYLITHDGANRLFRKFVPGANAVYGNGFGTIRILDNSFIGVNSIILPNTTIGPNSIVGAGSIVTKDVPEKAVFAGNPARYICSLDEYQEKFVQRLFPIHSTDRKSLRAELTKHFWGEER